MKNLNKPRFLISVLLLIIVTFIVYLNLDASSAFFSSTQLFLSEYLGWLIIVYICGGLYHLTSEVSHDECSSIDMRGNQKCISYPD